VCIIQVCVQNGQRGRITSTDLLLDSHRGVYCLIDVEQCRFRREQNILEDLGNEAVLCLHSDFRAKGWSALPFDRVSSRTPYLSLTLFVS